jgi:hypothetical protein
LLIYSVVYVTTLSVALIIACRRQQTKVKYAPITYNFNLLDWRKVENAYSVEYTKIPKALFKPHNLRRCCINVILGDGRVLGQSCTNGILGHCYVLSHSCTNFIHNRYCLTISSNGALSSFFISNPGSRFCATKGVKSRRQDGRTDRQTWPAHKVFFALLER